MALSTDTVLTNAYKANDLGDIKPTIVIGGTTEKFVPNMNISYKLESDKEQYYININRKSVTVDKEVQSLASEKLALTVGNETDIWHINEKGEFEWDIEFTQKPSTNTFSWALTHTEGIEFHYQPALTQEQIDRKIVRPDNVVGSYAVYCNQSGHYKDADGNTKVNYQTGKLLHIYRPLCTDAKGNTTWAELLIEKGTLTITIPQKYLDNAVYPVTLDPTFGYTSVGASEDGWVDPNQLDALVTSAPGSSGTGDSISFYTISYWDNWHWKGVLIDHTGSDVIVSNGVTNAFTMVNDYTWGWDTSSFATGPTITSGNEYWIGVIGDEGLMSRFDTVSSTKKRDTSNSYTTPADPNPWTHTYNEKMSIYCTYTESGGGDPEGSLIHGKLLRGGLLMHGVLIGG